MGCVNAPHLSVAQTPWAVRLAAFLDKRQTGFMPLEEQGDRSSRSMTSMHVRQAVAGSDASLAWLVEHLNGALLAQARYRLGRLRGVCEAEDLVNDAWLVALGRLAALTEREGHMVPVLMRFLSTTILHRVSNLMRKQAKAPGSISTALRLDLALSERSGVITQVVRAERQDAVAAAIDGLEELDREILILRGIEQQSNATVCVLLGLTKSAVAKRYTRALARLRDQLPGSIFDDFSD